MNTKPLNEQAQLVLNAIAGGYGTRESIAERTKIEARSVNGTVNGLARKGLVEQHDGIITATPDGMAMAKVRKARTNTKMEKARQVFAKIMAKAPAGQALDRQAVLHTLMKECELTEKGANAYYQNLRKEQRHATGIVFQQARRGPKVKKPAGGKATASAIAVAASKKGKATAAPKAA